MLNTKIMASVIVLALIGFGVITIVIPLPEVSAQGNMTGNQTANITDVGSGRISGSLVLP